MTTNPTDLIARAREVCEAATPGPFMIVDSDDGWELHSYHNAANVMMVAEKMREVDADLFAQSRQLLPKLADALEAAVELCERVANKRQVWESSSEQMALERDEARAEVARLEAELRGRKELQEDAELARDEAVAKRDRWEHVVDEARADTRHFRDELAAWECPTVQGRCDGCSRCEKTR